MSTAVNEILEIVTDISKITVDRTLKNLQDENKIRKIENTLMTMKAT